MNIDYNAVREASLQTRIEELKAKLEESRRLLDITLDWYVVNDHENNARSLRKCMEKLFEEGGDEV